MLKPKTTALPAPPPWVNQRHEEIQRDIAIELELDRHIAHAYATDYGEAPGITIGDIAKGVVGAAAMYAGIALMILTLQS